MAVQGEDLDLLWGGRRALPFSSCQKYPIHRAQILQGVGI